MILKKIKYALKGFIRDFRGKEDYWHIRTQARNGLKDENQLEYFLDFSKKAEYPFKYQDRIPIVFIDSKPTIFPITVFNYGLGLIDAHLAGKDMLVKIKSIYEWTVRAQTKDGFWLSQHESEYWGLKSGWKSAMAQGLAISFLYRCYKMGVTNRQNLDSTITNAISAMFSSDLINITEDGIILQEYQGTNSNILNGFIFAMYGLYDYGRYSDDYNYYENALSTLLKILPQYCFHRWTYYSTGGILASNFYHYLHIEQLKALNELSPNDTLTYYSSLWEKGLKKQKYYVLLKSFQKIYTFKSVNTLD